MDLVSIILPTYNRQKFLAQAFASIRAQLHTHWELIIVDDGSSDDSAELISALVEGIEDKVRFIQQENQGPAVARNTGIKLAKGDYIAFFDSDDEWLAHHLSDSIVAFTKHPEISWVYAACKRIDFSTQEVVLESTFYTNNKPNPLFNLKAKIDGNLHIIQDKNAACCQIFDGIDSGLQNSVIKKAVFDEFLLPEYRIGEDRLFILMALKANFTLAFIDNIHVLYNVHDENISDTSAGDERFDRRIVAMQRLLESYEQANNYVHLNNKEKKALNTRLALDYFWKLGYSLQQQAGYYDDAIATYKKAIKLCPLSYKFWKTYLSALLKYKFKQYSPESNKTKLLVLGDSHTETFRLKALQRYFPQYIFKVVPVGGATVSGIQNPNSKTQALPIFEKNITEFSPDKVIIQLGEVDTGFVIWYRAEKYQVSVDKMLIQAVENYTNLLSKLTNSAQVICISTVLPTIKDKQSWGEIANARKEIKATQLERTELTLKFNQRIQEYCLTHDIDFISLDLESLAENGIVSDKLMHSDPNDHHYNQAVYSSMLVKYLMPIL